MFIEAQESNKILSSLLQVFALLSYFVFLFELIFSFVQTFIAMTRSAQFGKIYLVLFFSVFLIGR